MKKLLIVAVAFCAAFTSCKNSTNIKSYSDVDSLSYAIGIDITNQLGVRAIADSALNADAIAAGVRDFFADKTAMTPEAATAFVNEFFQVRLPAKQRAENKAWLDKALADNSNAKTTGTGLVYDIINPGDPNAKPEFDADQVVVNYVGTLKDGTEFDRGDSISFQINRVIPGWTEGIKLIGKGGQIALWIPSELAYGPQPPYGSKIPANAALKFDVELLDVISVDAAQ